jgi:SAM-dependent methyltransferase
MATGGGHTGLTFAPYVANVVASDLTYRMLHAARDHALAKNATNILYCQHDAEYLPFASGTFDCVTCRIAPHHFENVARFVQESSRVLKSGGVLAVADNVVSGEPQIARLANLIEAYRDPSHNWAYSMDDWGAFFFGAGLQVSRQEEFRKELDFDDWAARLSLGDKEMVRLRGLLLRGPDALQEWFAPHEASNRLKFSLHEGITIGHKS